MTTHIPVLIDPIMNIVTQELSPLEGKVVFDGTFGAGGYSRRFLNQSINVVACDRDPLAIEANTIANPDLKLIQGSYADVIDEVEENFDFIVLDLGFSSTQLDQGGRGFSYLIDEPFDLRYNNTIGVSATELIQKSSPENLSKIIFTYSGEKMSKKIAFTLKELFDNNPNPTTHQVAESIKSIIPASQKKHTNKTLSRVWQALRIEVNSEFSHIEKFLPIAASKLKQNGLLAVVSFHSLEDKIITKWMRTAAKPFEIDDYGNKKQSFRLLTKQAITPTQEEIDQNPRSRSALLRILKKL